MNAKELLQAYGYRVADTPDDILQFRQKAHPRGWVWLLWVVTAVLGVGMLVRALTVSNNQDLLIAVAATVISILLAWNNHRMYTRPFQAVLQLGKDGFTLTDRKQSLHFQPESIQEFILLSDDNASNLFIKLDNQNVKPLLFRFSGKPTEQLQQDMEAMKKQAENLLGKAK